MLLLVSYSKYNENTLIIIYEMVYMSELKSFKVFFIDMILAIR